MVVTTEKKVVTTEKKKKWKKSAIRTYISERVYFISVDML